MREAPRAVCARRLPARELLARFPVVTTAATRNSLALLNSLIISRFDRSCWATFRTHWCGGNARTQFRQSFSQGLFHAPPSRRRLGDKPFSIRVRQRLQGTLARRRSLC